MSDLQKLIDIFSCSLNESQPDMFWLDGFAIPDALKDDYKALLRARNGCFAFESALVLYPASCAGGFCGAQKWNCEHDWLKQYGIASEDYVLFGADLFSVQFALSKRGIETFDVEQGAFTLLAENFEQWAGKMLEEFNFLTGWNVAHEWQKFQRRGIREGYRLLPKQPFILGGAYHFRNMLEIRMEDAMRKNIRLYEQTKDKVDGTKVTVRGWV